jgi:PHD/YefM family antitoxin component YafN of YafNO toxin-antitoxin module
MKRIKNTGRPLVLTVNGKAEAGVLDAEFYRPIASHPDSIAAMRRGLAQAKKGKGCSVDSVFDNLERKLKSGNCCTTIAVLR